jgi:capsular exopolysaccharide synthesis family protein
MASIQQREDHSGLPALLVALRRRLGLVLACAVLVPAAALAFSLAQEKEYSASASLLFRDPQFDQKLFGSTVFAPNTDPTREAATNVKLVSLQVVSARTSRALKGRLAPSEIAGKVQVASAGQSDVANITAVDHDPKFAAKLADTFATQFIAFRRDADRSKINSAQKLVQEKLAALPASQRAGAQATALRKQAEQLQILAALQTGNAELVQPAETPTAPSSPKPVRNSAIGLIFGLLLGIGLALLLERLDRRLKTPKEIGEAFDRPVLGAIPESRAIASLPDNDPQRLAPGEAEAFRMLRANLRYFNVDRAIRSVLITSSAPADGKSTVAMHLASAAGAAGSRTLLLEADLRHPTLARRLKVPNQRGLSQVLAGQAGSLQDVAHSVPVAGRRPADADFRTIDVVVCGPIPPNPTDLIESERMRELIRGAEDVYDLVVIDTPPTSVVSDAIPLVKEVSGVIVVSRLGKTTRESANHLRGQLENLEANLLGVVVNSVGRQSGYGYNYGYGYGYGTGAEPQGRRRRGSGPPDLEPTPEAAEAQTDERTSARTAVAEPEPSASTNGANGESFQPGPDAGSPATPTQWDASQPSRRGRLGRRSSRRQSPPRS